MNKPIQTCALVGNFQDSSVSDCVRSLIPALLERGVAVLVDEESATCDSLHHATPLPTAEMIARADLLIAVGGDGTLLYAAGLVAQRDVPLLGINRGRLGFLTDVLPQDMARSLDAVLAGECQADRRPLLQARLLSPRGEEVSHYALNDVVFNRLDTGRLLNFETRIDGRYVNSHGGDGMVVATATGSTAYALSCGGPIVDPRLAVLVVAPICPHTLSDRPIIVPGDSTIDVRLIGPHQTFAQVTCDASVLGALEPGGRLEIMPSARTVTLLHPPGYDYFRLLRSKLHWGLGGLAHER